MQSGPHPPGSSRFWTRGGSTTGSLTRTPSRLACRTRAVWQYRAAVINIIVDPESDLLALLSLALGGASVTGDAYNCVTYKDMESCAAAAVGLYSLDGGVAGLYEIGPYKGYLGDVSGDVAGGVAAEIDAKTLVNPGHSAPCQ